MFWHLCLAHVFYNSKWIHSWFPILVMWIWVIITKDKVFPDKRCTNAPTYVKIQALLSKEKQMSCSICICSRFCICIYRVINGNCVLWFLSEGRLKTKKWPNPTIFVELIYGHFDILMSQCGQMRKKLAFPGCAKIVLRFHTARTEKTDTPQTHQGTSNVHEYH